MSENGEIYTAGKNFTLPPALTAWTNSTSEAIIKSGTQLNSAECNTLTQQLICCVQSSPANTSAEQWDCNGIAGDWGVF